MHPRALATQLSSRHTVCSNTTWPTLVAHQQTCPVSSENETIFIVELQHKIYLQARSDCWQFDVEKGFHEEIRPRNATHFRALQVALNNVANVLQIAATKTTIQT